MSTVRKAAIIGTMALALAAPALAGPRCTTIAKDQWLSEASMKAKIAKDGYRIKTFLISGNCYEIYGFDQTGKKVEIYFNPVSGEIVKKKIAGN